MASTPSPNPSAPLPSWPSRTPGTRCMPASWRSTSPSSLSLPDCLGRHVCQSSRSSACQLLSRSHPTALKL
ncbi:hypothetical protein BRADI_1g34838v3 [Brachypodium distachyon]|uniref:Uncharacterized protein n=1 Tax=Brachypodium distachyon TaxID=15368 RepID=A0A2K2DMQ0_BRADI|nr:hypothetical protein BRADI_1g34838v3 [Brachypodium distachyon]